MAKTVLNMVWEVQNRVKNTADDIEAGIPAESESEISDLERDEVRFLRTVQADLQEIIDALDPS